MARHQRARRHARTLCSCSRQTQLHLRTRVPQARANNMSVGRRSADAAGGATTAGPPRQMP
eukprot:2365345-Alexandrium_andersonii.AAC.1